MNIFLRETWIAAVSNSMSFNLRNVGKGAFNINEPRWEIYKTSKLCKLMSVLRFKLQDSLRYLVQESLVSLTQLVLDACHSVLKCPQDLVWGDNLITSSYKYDKIHQSKCPYFLCFGVTNKLYTQF